jgi:predicted phage tail protein
LTEKSKSRTYYVDLAKNESFVFSGPVNQHGQGHILPLIYGQVRVGSFIASASIKAEEFVDTTAQNPQTVFGRAYNIITGVTLS